MNKLLIFCCLAFSCASGEKMITVTGINEAHVFVSFYKAGTTAAVRSLYHEEKDNPANKTKLSEEQLFKLKEILKNLKWKRHLQQKIAGIEKGIELCNANGCYCLVLTKDVMIDVTRGLECYLTTEQHMLILRAIG